MVPVAEGENKLWIVEEPLVRRLLVKKLEVEALPVTKREEAVVEARVEEAVERKPFKKARVVEVAFSLVESLVKGKESPFPPDVGQEVRHSLLMQRVLKVALLLKLERIEEIRPESESDCLVTIG